MSLPRLPRTIACIGRNFADHIKELGNARPKEPFFFLKAAGSVLYPGQGPVLVPKGCEMHYEVELAVVIGKGAGVGGTVDEWRGGRADLGGVVKGWCVGE